MKSHHLPSTAAIQVANFLLDEMCADSLTDFVSCEMDHFSQLRRVSTTRTYNSFGEVYSGGERLFYLTAAGNPVSLLTDEFDFAVEHDIRADNRFCAFPRVKI